MHTESDPPAPAIETETPYSPFRHLLAVLLRFYRVFRWVTLAGLIIMIVLIFHKSPPPEVETSPESTQSAENKIRQFQSSIKEGNEDTLEIDQSELNGWLDANLAIKKPQGPAVPVVRNADVASLARTALKAGDLKDSDVTQAQSSIKDVRIALAEDSLRLYMVFESHGMDLSMEIEGRPLVQEGYLRLEPLGGKFGSLPLPQATLRTLTSRLFDSPQNKEKFHLPPQIRDMRIENGRLVITS